MMDFQARNFTVRIARAGICAALIFIFTFAAIPVGALGYVHFGDAFLFAAAYFIGYDAAAAAILGSVLADCVVPGGLIFAPATAVIKGAMACFCAASFKKRQQSLTAMRTIGTLSIASLFMQFAYLGYTIFLLAVGGMEGSALEAAFWISFVLSFIQPAVGVPLGTIFISALKRLFIKKDSLPNAQKDEQDIEQ